MTGRSGAIAIAGKEHAVFQREQAQQLRQRFPPDRDVKAPRNIAATPSGRLMRTNGPGAALSIGLATT